MEAGVPNVNPDEVAAAGAAARPKDKLPTCGCAVAAGVPKLNPPPTGAGVLVPNVKEGAWVFVAAVEPNVNP